MKRRAHYGLIFLGGAALLVAPAIALPAGPRVDAGEWEFETTMDLPGAPKGMPAMRFTSCLSQDNPVPRQAGPKSGDCKVAQQGASGDTYTWTVQCRDKNMASETKGKGVYRGATMEGVQTITFSQSGAPARTMTQKMTGKRVGPCRSK